MIDDAGMQQLRHGDTTGLLAFGDFGPDKKIFQRYIVQYEV